jgi:hypothetical protein
VFDAVDDDGLGQFRITTRTGTRYFLDLDRRLIRREPAFTGSSALMRADGQDLDLVFLRQCRLGVPLVVLIDLHIRGACWTQRTSADVTRIRPARGEP